MSFDNELKEINAAGVSDSDIPAVSPSPEDCTFSNTPGIEYDRMKYRDFDIVFYFDEPGQQVYTIWDGEELCFGAFNQCYREDMMLVIDRRLDTLCTFGTIDRRFFGAFLRYFDNEGFRDIKLIYRNRILKVFLCDDFDAYTLEEIKKESIEILKKVLKIDC